MLDCQSLFQGSRARCSTKFLKDDVPVVQRILDIEIISRMPSLLLNTLNFKKVYGGMPFLNVPGLLSKTSTPFGLQLEPFSFPSLKTKSK